MTQMLTLVEWSSESEGLSSGRSRHLNGRDCVREPIGGRVLDEITHVLGEFAHFSPGSGGRCYRAKVFPDISLQKWLAP